MRRLFRLWRSGGRDLRVLFAILRNRHRPPWLIPALVALGVFALEPFNFALPVLGVVDDFIILPLVIRVIAKLAMASSVARFNPAYRDERVVSVQKR
jgi:uncharacterized membrane protein YkvA (DUF1232 family)